MAKFRKKPVVIEAVQYFEQDAVCPKDVADLCGGSLKVVLGGFDGVEWWLEIHTLEGKMNARPGDWIIKGVKGEIYPCKPDIFAATYEPVAG